MVSLNLARLAVLTLTLGCAATVKQAPGGSGPPAASAPARARMAWMPCDARAQPELAAAVNGRLEQAKVAGVKESFQASVSMEMAQLAIECIEPTPACYRAVGHSLGADRLMWAEIDPGDDKIRVSVMFFDVSSGETSRKVGTFEGVQAARAGVAQLVAFAADPRSRAQ